ncbi:MAG TPA: hypothetical protein VGG39_27945 [Polyangiaceae bacterium]
MALDPLRPDLFAPEHYWARAFPSRESRDDELELLERLFPLSWRVETFGASGPPRRKVHRLRDELRSNVGCTRLLDIAAALRLLGAGPIPDDPASAWRIPLQGSLRYPSQYEHAWSEALVGVLLQPVGHVVWQPSRRRRGPRADYYVRHRVGQLVVEVKRIRVGRTTRALYDRRDAEWAGGKGWVLTAAERRECRERDIPRLYRRVRHAAGQLAASSADARELAPAEGRVPGVLFLDVDANPPLLNLRRRLRRWSRRHEWARAIDGVVAFNYRGHVDGRAGTVAQAIYIRKRRRSHEAMNAIFSAYPLCELQQIHVGGLPDGPCTIPIGL